MEIHEMPRSAQMLRDLADVINAGPVEGLDEDHQLGALLTSVTSHVSGLLAARSPRAPAAAAAAKSLPSPFTTPPRGQWQRRPSSPSSSSLPPPAATVAAVASPSLRAGSPVVAGGGGDSAVLRPEGSAASRARLASCGAAETQSVLTKALELGSEAHYKARMLRLQEAQVEQHRRMHALGREKEALESVLARERCVPSARPSPPP
jgi:hypothetical protein